MFAFLELTLADYAVYITGILALVCFAISFQAKKRSTLLILQTTSLMLFMVQYFFLDAYTGLILEVVCIARNFTYYFRGKNKLLNTILTPLVFILAAIVVGIFTFDGHWYCVIPVLANVLQTIGLDMKNERNNRIFFLLASPLWLTYNLINNSIFGVATEVANIISIIISIIIITRKYNELRQKQHA